MPNHIRTLIKVITVVLLTVICGTVAASAAKQKEFVVAIDAGHGGKDVGASDNGVTEKDINLGVAKKLAELLKKKGFKVIMTRDGDKFVNLSDRPAKANKEKADLFISIHTNSLDADNPNRKNVEGSQVYVLGLHRDADNLAVARRENSVIVQEKNHEEKYENFDPDKDESYIIFEMAQKKTLANSIGFAQEVQNELKKTAGRRDRGVHQAGFLVLREAAMPAVLVEVDFICNPNSAKYIGSSAGQKKLAQAIANAVVTYHNNLKKNDAAYQNASLDGAGSSNGDVYVLSNAGTSGRRSTTAKRPSTTSKTNNTNGVRRRRSATARQQSENRNLETDQIILRTESQGIAVESTTPATTTVNEPTTASTTTKDKSSSKKNDKKKKENKKKSKQKDEEQDIRIVNGKRVVVQHQSSQPSQSAPRSLKSNKPTTKADPEPKEARNAVKASFGDTTENTDNTLAEEDVVATEAVQAQEVSSDTESATARKRVKVKSNTEKASKSEKEQKRAQQIKEEQATQDVNENNKRYEETKQRANETTGAPKSLKSKKR